MSRWSHLGSIALFSAALASAAWAEATPQRGNRDERVRVASYVDGEVYRLNTNLTHVTSVEFAPGETITSIVAGDTEGFLFDGVPGGQAFAVKPVMSGVSTNINVYTNLRSYYFNVVEGGGPTYYVVRFAYPGASAPPRNAVVPRPTTYRYGVSGEAEFAPVAVSDDGTFTYFQFGSNAPLPAILRVGPEGGERTANSSSREDGVVRVSGISPRWVLRLGEEVVCVQAQDREAGS
ncbi:TrbG/VirB9 family P-type conjugative transfer protein [Rubellimicrobium aerolatum]|uniref:TrbG/VirB9 family P-type conjugative transfer protein n=1 Tax=Rubellimicrobium aerolatum TaxID=490979 RepID=A0ABW0SE00_9RHOB|nr:TrbG/VirB9 family P-type conjugative transfer protein [Rubellimicrobium aerolatum]MBP1806987.1 type IV secretion system protein VirB9 [Rubellimicrobium aerolatum]